LLQSGKIERLSLKAQLIAIDGPVAAGKSSVGTLLAKRLGYFFFDTGIMYRAFTWKALKSGVSPQDENKLYHLASTTKFAFIADEKGHFSPLINDKDIFSELFCPQVEEQVSLVAKVAGVRQVMVSEQRRLAQQGKMVMAGRDIGTVVLPWADLKIFLVASTEERAHRRYIEICERAGKIDYNVVLADLKRRDEIDRDRAISPLKPAADAIIINTDKLSLEQVVDKIYALAVK
jgi:cytidylate kinase